MILITSSFFVMFVVASAPTFFLQETVRSDLVRRKRLECYYIFGSMSVSCVSSDEETFAGDFGLAKLLVKEDLASSVLPSLSLSLHYSNYNLQFSLFIFQS